MRDVGAEAEAHTVDKELMLLLTPFKACQSFDMFAFADKTQASNPPCNSPGFGLCHG